MLATEELGYTYPDFNGLDPYDPEYVKILQEHINELYQKPVKPSFLERNPSKILDWTIRVRVKKHELGDSFNILFFLTPDIAEVHGRTSTAYIGSYGVFVNSATEACANCRVQAEEGLVIQGFIPLNTKIEQFLGLRTFSPVAITPYLTDNLKWKVEKVSFLAVPLRPHRAY